jgi:hypothetical protein
VKVAAQEHFILVIPSETGILLATHGFFLFGTPVVTGA